MGFAQLVCHAEKGEANHKQQCQRTNSDTRVHDSQAQEGKFQTVGELADESHHSGAHKGGTLTEDIHQAVVLAAFISGDDLAQVGTAECLNAALEHTHQYSQDPELDQGGEENSKKGNARIAEDTDLQQQTGIILACQTAKENGEGEGYDLGHQQRKQQTGGIKTQGFAVGGSHIDDGVNTVNKEEESDQVQEDVLLLLGFLDGLPKLTEGLQESTLHRRLVSGLLMVLHQRQGAGKPPGTGDGKADDQSGDLRNAEAFIAKGQHKAQGEGNAGADVAEGIAGGGDPIHPFRGGDLREHCIVEYQAGGIANSGHYEDHQEGKPAPGSAQSKTGKSADQHCTHKQGLFIAFPVSQCAAQRADDGNQNGSNRAGIAPVGKVIGLRNTGGGCQRVKVDRQQSCYQQDKGRVANIIEVPALFGFVQLQFFHRQFLLSLYCTLTLSR